MFERKTVIQMCDSFFTATEENKILHPLFNLSELFFGRGRKESIRCIGILNNKPKDEGSVSL